MSRPSACKDPSLWHGMVMRYLDKMTKGRLVNLSTDAPWFYTLASPDSPNYALEEWPVSVRYASAIVHHFYACQKKNVEADPRTISFIDAARERYCSDPRREKDPSITMKRALGLMPKRGNPSRVSIAPRHLSEEEFGKVGEQAYADIARGMTEGQAVGRAAADYDVTERHVRDSLRDCRMKKAVREVRPRVITRYIRRGKRKPPE
jgi:hypothetical protein